MARNWIYLRIIQIGFDALGIYVAFLLAYFVRVKWIFSTDFPFAMFAWMAVVGTVAWIVFLLFTKVYRIPPRSGQGAVEDFVLILTGGVIAVCVLIVSYFFPREVLFSRLIGVYIFIFGSAWLVLTQWIFRLILIFQKKHFHGYRTLIVGANRVAEKLIAAIQNDLYAPHQIIGAIDPYGMTKVMKGTQILGKLDQLEKVCQEKKVTEIIQCDAYEHTLNLISFCDEKNIKFQFDPALRGIFEENLRVRTVANQTMISFVQRKFTGVKRGWFCFVDWVLGNVFDID